MVTDDDGRYAFTDLPAGLYSLSEKQPAACIDGLAQAGTIDGTTVGVAASSNQITTIDLPGTQSGVDYRFTETSLRPECIPNRILSTSVQPVGSTNWKKMIRDTMARAESASGSATAAASPAGTTRVATPAAQPPTVAYAVRAAPVSRSAQIPLARATASVAPAGQPPADAGVSTSGQPAGPLTTDQLRFIVNQAIADWAAAGLSGAMLDRLRGVDFAVADLPGSQLGWTEDDHVVLDRDGAGYGWFVDATPAQDEEFQRVRPGGQLQAIDPAVIGRMDLLSVVEHELGHIAGLVDLDSALDDLMSSSLSKGIRRKVSVADVDAVFAAYYGR